MSDEATSPARPVGRDAHTVLGALSRGDRAAFVTEEGTSSWAEWLVGVDRLAERFEDFRGARVGLVLRPSERAYAAMAALALRDCDAYLLDAGMGDAERIALAESVPLDLLIDPCGSERPDGAWAVPVGRTLSRSGRGRVTLFTSGSTDRPKPVCHDWSSLTRPVRRARGAPRARWLLTYRPHLYAGLQVFFHCLINQETLVLPGAGMPVEGLLDLMVRAGVTSVSATPSYWRRLITMGRADDLGRVPLEQITLGGEVADQGLLDALRRNFPRARLVHIYATSELGRCFSVTDGRAGFPTAFLDAPSEEGVELKVEDGELFVRSANAMLGEAGSDEAGTGAGAWIPTGDLVESDGDRWFFAGRRNEILNVGGNKVQPVRVERTIQRVAGVRDVRVFGRRSSLVGQMVACEFVAEPGRDAPEVARAIQEACLKELAAHERPRFVEAVPAITLSDAGKKIRQSPPPAPRGAEA